MLVKRHLYTVDLRKSWQLFIEQGDASCEVMSEGKFHTIKEKTNDLCGQRNVPRSRVRQKSVDGWNERHGTEKRKSTQFDRTKEKKGMTSPSHKILPINPCLRIREAWISLVPTSPICVHSMVSDQHMRAYAIVLFIRDTSHWRWRTYAKLLLSLAVTHGTSIPARRFLIHHTQKMMVGFGWLVLAAQDLRTPRILNKVPALLFGRNPFVRIPCVSYVSAIH